MLSREAADTTKGSDPEHPGTVHESECTEPKDKQCCYSELILCARAVWNLTHNSDVGLQEQGRVCTPSGSMSPGKWARLSLGSRISISPGQVRSDILLQPSSSYLQVTARQVMNREISGPRQEEF